MSLTYTQVNKIIADRQRQRDTNHQVKKTTGGPCTSMVRASIKEFIGLIPTWNFENINFSVVP